MRDYRNAKAMAQTLREALIRKSVDISHSESLELIAHILGLRDWNVLAARIAADEAQEPAAAAGARTASTTMFCSFCGKSQHEVSKLVAGPDVFICDECVGLCDDVLLDGYPTKQFVPEDLATKTTEELFLLKAKLGRDLSTSRRLLATLKPFSEVQAADDEHAPQVKFFLRKPSDQRAKYLGDIEGRITSIESTMAATLEALSRREAPN